MSINSLSRRCPDEAGAVRVWPSGAVNDVLADCRSNPIISQSPVLDFIVDREGLGR